MESFAQGTAVIGANIGGIPELIDPLIIPLTPFDKGGQNTPTGVLFEAGNVEDLKAKMSLLMENPKLALEKGRNARQKVEREYGAERHYERLMEVYGNVVKNNVMP